MDCSVFVMYNLLSVFDAKSGKPLLMRLSAGKQSNKNDRIHITWRLWMCKIRLGKVTENMEIKKPHSRGDFFLIIITWYYLYEIESLISFFQ